MLSDEKFYSVTFEGFFSSICDTCHCGSERCELDPDCCYFSDKMEELKMLCWQTENLFNEIYKYADRTYGSDIDRDAQLHFYDDRY